MGKAKELIESGDVFEAYKEGFSLGFETAKQLLAPQFVVENKSWPIAGRLPPTAKSARTLGRAADLLPNEDFT